MSNTTNYKPFDLAAALAHPERVVCRNGQRPSELQFLKTVTGLYPLVVVIEGEIIMMTKGGKLDTGDYGHSLDLFLLPETVTVWQNYYRYAKGSIRAGGYIPFDTKEQAEEGANLHPDYIGTFPTTITL